jgi:Kef-type K+ transport system membrane component KefB
VLDLKLLLVQLVVIVAAARLCGRLMRHFGQPQVVGEMLAGIALGPSLLGWVAPGALAALFPADRMLPLAVLSQIGVLLFMFVVGLRFDLALLQGRTRAAVATSHASIAAPFALSILAVPLFYPRLAGPGVERLPFALFFGAAMSVTAFPVLARILTERGLLGTRVGSVAIACAAVDDVTAWCLLAGVVALARAGNAAESFGLTMVATGVFAALLWKVGRPLLARAAERLGAGGAVTPQVVSGAVLVALAAAAVTEHIGVHALFGAFLVGAVIPRSHAIATTVADRIEDVVAAVLLPVFFAFTGLRTSIALVSGGAMWGLAAVAIAIAVAGKLGGSAVAARASGMPWREAFAIGVLMNTRGLMELVILNVGLEIGVISQALYSIMVVMAVVTTVATTPLLALVYRAPAGAHAVPGDGAPPLQSA